MNAFRRRLLGELGHEYTLLGGLHGSDLEAQSWRRKHSLLLIVLVALAGLAAVFVSSSYSLPESNEADGPCDFVSHGYLCETNISHFWGQYSPYFSVASEIPLEIPQECSITFAQILSRHGARFPTSSKTEQYNSTIQKLQRHVKSFTGKYAFLGVYEYTLGADQLTVFGQQELFNSGVKYYDRYKGLTRDVLPFVRSSGGNRVVESAKNWTQGFQAAKLADKHATHGLYPDIDVIIPEADYGVNNTLSHDLCTKFENGTYGTIAGHAQGKWASIFIPPIRKRLNNHLPGANLSIGQTIDIMDLCPFSVVASAYGKISPFCGLFTKDEWHQYNYYETLNKWYGHSYGNPLGPTQGVGFVNELIARMIDQPVNDETSTNHTLDRDPKTFPFGRKLYADFSHDNDMMAIFSALGVYNGTSQFPNTTIVEAQNANGYSAAWTVPFAARAYFEKMKCAGHDEELVRVILNDRVLPLTQCDGDRLGCCRLTAFINSLAFAKMGGNWDACFA